MNRELLMRILLACAAGFVSLAIYFITSAVMIVKSPGKRVKDMVDESATSFFDLGGNKLAKRMKEGFLDSWKIVLFWAQINGSFTGWTVGGMLMRGFILAIAGMIMIVVFQLPVYTWLVVPFALFVPYILVNGKSRETTKQVKRLLPETATVIAAEMDAGSTASQAVGRAGELPGPLGHVINLSVAKSRQSERAMFSHGANKGILMEELNKFGMPELSRFAMQLDRVASKGVDAPRVMVEIAKGLAREYKSQVQQVASNMDTELLIPMTLLFFLPFIVSMLAPIIVSFNTAF